MKKILSLLVVVLLIFTFSCKKSEKEESGQTGKAARHAEQVAKDEGQAVKKTEEAKTKVVAVDFKFLQELLPEKEGWTKSNIRGQKFSYGEAETSMAEADYTLGGTRVHVRMLDSAAYTAAIGGFLYIVQTGFAVEDGVHYQKTVKVKGYPAIEEYNYRRKNGKLSVLVNNRYLIDFIGENIEKTNILYDFFDAFDVNRFE